MWAATNGPVKPRWHVKRFAGASVPRTERPDAVAVGRTFLLAPSSLAQRRGAGVEPTEPWATRPHCF
jgi:hypothetical protein